MKKLFIFTCVALFFSLSIANAESTDEKRQLVIKLLQITGSEKLMKQQLEEMRSRGLSIPRVNTKELLARQIPIYEKYFTVEDLKAIVAFSNSKAGRKQIAIMPTLLQEVNQVSIDYFQEMERRRY